MLKCASVDRNNVLAAPNCCCTCSYIKV